MTTLVTGGTGFAGINTVLALAEAGEYVVALDKHPASEECREFLQPVADKVDLVVGDVVDLKGVLRLAEEREVRRIVHGAAITPSGDVEQRMPRHVVSVNLMGTVNLLEVAQQTGVERFVFMSSSGVYGAPKNRTESVSEDSLLKLDKLYGICKYACELLLKRYKSLFNLSAVSGRMCAIYGPMERPTPSRGAPSTVYRLVGALLAQQPVSARGRQFVRDYTHVEDACTIWKDLTLARSLQHDVYNVSAGVAYSLDDLLQTLQDVDPSFTYRHAEPDESADVEIAPEGERGALNISRVRTELGFSPKYDLRQGLESYLEWARQHPVLFSP